MSRSQSENRGGDNTTTVTLTYILEYVIPHIAQGNRVFPNEILMATMKLSHCHHQPPTFETWMGKFVCQQTTSITEIVIVGTSP